MPARSPRARAPNLTPSDSNLPIFQRTRTLTRACALFLQRHGLIVTSIEGQRRAVGAGQKAANRSSASKRERGEDRRELPS
eukprot:2472242-Alexandrium_andersonii.AAC.1